MVLAGLLLGIFATVAILYAFLVVLVLPNRESISTFQQHSFQQHSSQPQRLTTEVRELSDLQALMEIRQPQPVEAQSWHQDSEYLALKADIQAESQAYQRIPTFLRGFMPKPWKKAWQYSESLTYVNDSIPKILGNWDSREFSRQCTPTLLKSTQKDSLDQSFADLLGRCGQMTAYQGIKYFGLDNLRGDSVWQFVAQADFENGWAIITGRVIWQGQRCWFDHFSISNAI